MSLKGQFISHLCGKHPTISREALDQLISPQLLSPFEINLPRSILSQAQDFVSACYELREKESYRDFLSPEIKERAVRDPGNKSILMSYDFHVDSEGSLKLIEINTNASFLALGSEMYHLRGLPLPVRDFTMDEIGENIRTELKLQGQSGEGPIRMAIIDEDPPAQRLFAEFLVYQAYFQEWGFDCLISDYRDIPEVQFIYNRFTDFYLSQTESQELRRKFLDRSVCLSPNPYEYLLLADKQRMIDWQSDRFWERISDPGTLRERISRNLPEARDLNPQSAEEIWAARKKFFIKPKRAFGSKQSYRGGSISRKAFDEILSQGFIAQEFVPAPERVFKTPEGDEQRFKFDLRFYAYQGRVQMAVARLYQGQVTNLRTPYGGFAPLVFG